MMHGYVWEDDLSSEAALSDVHQDAIFSFFDSDGNHVYFCLAFFVASPQNKLYLVLLLPQDH